MGKEKAAHHVVLNPAGGWSVKRSGAARASATAKTQQQAIELGQQISRNQGSDLIIHGRDGRIKRHG